MTENALSILIIFSVQLQQTEISDRKPFIFQHGLPGTHFGRNTHFRRIYMLVFLIPILNIYI